MGKYQPLYISNMKEGLIQERVEFILPNDAYPVLENMFVWRERIRRKRGCIHLDRLGRDVSTTLPASSGASPWSFNAFTFSSISGEPNAELQIGSVTLDIAGETFTDQGDGTLKRNDGNLSSTVNYVTGDLVIVTTQPAGSNVTLAYHYYPGLPVMGLRSRELDSINDEACIAFDTKYAYSYSGGWYEFIPGTTWSGTDYNFFWSTNYWVSAANQKLFWVTNFSGTTGDPIRYTDGSTWTDFAPQVGIDPGPPTVNIYLTQSLTLVPYRNRLVACNTWEGQSLATSVNYPQRIRWSALGNPLEADAWRDDIIGKGGYIEVPTAEDIISVGFVRDNLVVFCERSTWQLRYTGRSIQPFQLEKVNTEMGTESTFSNVQFDTSIIGIGDKGIIQCDSFSSKRIDIKIPDWVFYINNTEQGPQRVQGIRDFVQRLAYWTYPYVDATTTPNKFPNRRLIYNYENDSWAIFTDSITALGTFQPTDSPRWQDVNEAWEDLDVPWVTQPAGIPSILGGNQQGYTFYLDRQDINDPELSIQGITGYGTAVSSNPVLITSSNHNLEENSVIKITGILAGTDFEDLNDRVYQIQIVDADSFTIWSYDATTESFSSPVQKASGTYIGGGEIAVRDNFSIISKKFNFLEEGQNIQIGFIDALFNTTNSGEITLNIYVDYNDSLPVNQDQPDTFFNQKVSTAQTSGIQSSKCWQRIFCPTRGNFITIEWTLSDEQMAGTPQEEQVEIFSQILWLRKAGRQLVNA